eukprot:gnl/TRDRNA2_/TRDRNA2_152771_c1_seq2.p1 gnl/TRDRNA2_/TRDRNA2_152771_c1~~gnl/TRDRNA2_/TRDRNA2_152771_c1_seq2.p1  ORF type:complete len:115 (+),score=18.25 gnl/TRDRNA2_/TRDRNA2_152771_c1_seq2:114-458(+)
MQNNGPSEGLAISDLDKEDIASTLMQRVYCGRQEQPAERKSVAGGRASVAGAAADLGGRVSHVINAGRKSVGRASVGRASIGDMQVVPLSAPMNGNGTAKSDSSSDGSVGSHVS